VDLFDYKDCSGVIFQNLLSNMVDFIHLNKTEQESLQGKISSGFYFFPIIIRAIYGVTLKTNQKILNNPRNE
jgi:hypothetical protein